MKKPDKSKTRLVVLAGSALCAVGIASVCFYKFGTTENELHHIKSGGNASNGVVTDSSMDIKNGREDFTVSTDLNGHTVSESYAPESDYTVQTTKSILIETSTDKITSSVSVEETQTDSVSADVPHSSAATTNSGSDVTTHTQTTSLIISEATTEDCPWDELELYQKFPIFSLDDDSLYSAEKDENESVIVISEDKIDDLVKKAEISADSEYSNHSHDSAGVSFYTIKGFSEKIFTAVKYDASESYYLFRNEKYIPETLGDYIEALKIEEFLTASVIRGEKIEDDTCTFISYTNFDNERIINLLDSETECENIYDYGRSPYTYGGGGLIIEVNHSDYFSNNDRIYVYDNGRIVVDIAKVYAEFQLSPKTTREFTEYIQNECEVNVEYQVSINE